MPVGTVSRQRFRRARSPATGSPLPTAFSATQFPTVRFLPNSTGRDLMSRFGPLSWRYGSRALTTSCRCRWVSRFPLIGAILAAENESPATITVWDRRSSASSANCASTGCQSAWPESVGIMSKARLVVVAQEAMGVRSRIGRPAQIHRDATDRRSWRVTDRVNPTHPKPATPASLCRRDERGGDH